MVGLVWPMYLVFLIPMILIEWYVAKRCLPKIGLCKIFGAVTLANIVTNLLGIPLILILVEVLASANNLVLPKLGEIFETCLLIIKAPWNLYTDDVALILVFLLIATLASMPGFYFLSVWMERLIVTRVFKISPDVKLIRRVCWKMNLVSYGFFFALCLGTLTYIAGIGAK